MTRKALIFCLYLLLTQAVFIRRSSYPTPIERLRELKEHGDFASNMISNIELHLQMGGKVDEVISFVEEALANAQANKNTLNTEYRAEMGRLGGLIDDYSGELQRLQANLTTVTEKIDSLGQEIEDLGTTIGRLEGDLEGLSIRERAINSARENDIAAYQRRQQRDNNAINALEEIIPSLENLLTTGQAFLQKPNRDIVNALRKIPETKPIKALVELSTQFNEEKLREVITKLADILEAVESGKRADEQQEVQSRVRFEALISEVGRIRDFKARSLATARDTKQQKEAALAAAQSQRNNIVTNIQATTTLKENTEQLKENAEASYTRRIAEATSSVEALRAALDILTENEATLASQEGQADTNTAES